MSNVLVFGTLKKGVVKRGSYQVEMMQRRADGFCQGTTPWQVSQTCFKNLAGQFLSSDELLPTLTSYICYKIMHGLVAGHPGGNTWKPTKQSRHTKKSIGLYTCCCNTESQKLSFYPRTFNDWKSLPDYSIFSQAQNVMKFKILISNSF